MSHNKAESEASAKEIVKYINAISGPLTIVDLEQVTKLLAAFAESRERARMEELQALRNFKKEVDILVTAGLLGMSGEIGFKQLTRWEADFTKEPYMRVSKNGEWVRFADLQTVAEPTFPK